ncbi:putative CRISPR-associated protein [Halothermothrix orenii]|uniref:Putative CRISPR-associated protein, APE2256 family n=1 Tax=Halothermothrix orenii (strain H 168 / OCM 544 / DSM 9562) TaxID=373903 RepID=B8CY91_HALOH|nr:putative CRISPR-associated protein [Halothermothrix orenii]ACL70260.1 putative CRISPR-associated protein, APE2256 family [Halothermothrix orenii H 168]
MKKILTTVGTSLLTHLREEEEIGKSEYDYFLDNKDDVDKVYYDRKGKDKIHRLKKVALNYLSKKDINNNEDLNNMSAELKSIKKIIEYKNIKQYEIIFICSDTLAGKVVTDILMDYIIESKFNYTDIKTKLIKKLQVQNKARFEKSGVHNLIEYINTMVNNTGSNNLILNITGGYKSVVPYMTIMGYVNEIPVYYIFEETNELIELPLIPIKVDEELFKKYMCEIHQIMDKGVINKDLLEQILNKVDWNDKQLIKTRLLQNDLQEPDYYYPSPITRIFWEKFKSNYIFNIELSDSAYEFYSRKEERARFILEKVSDYDLRKKHYHYIKGTDMDCYKSGGEELFRVFYKVYDKEDRNAIVKVAEIFDLAHKTNEYDNFCKAPRNSNEYQFNKCIIKKSNKSIERC